MKKLIGAVFISLLAVSMTACGGSNKIEEAGPPLMTNEAIVHADSQAESTGTDTDGQNPVMNFVGHYGAGEADILVEPLGKDSAQLTVNWTTGAESSGTWTMSGVFDLNTYAIEYKDCVKTNRVLTEDGSVQEETVVYENGTGRVMFNTLDNTAIWEDENEHVADELVFEYVYPADVTAEESGET